MVRLILLTLSAIFISLTFNSCSLCQEVVEVEVDRPIYIDVPVSCTVPDTNCSWSDIPSNQIPIEMLKCIYDLKISIRVCSGR